jgi:hypothetical protein
MALPFVPHDSAVDEDTLAEAFEGEVGSVRLILRMFETSFRRLFLKFERFSSLRKSCRARARLRHRRGGVHSGRREAARRIGLNDVRNVPERAIAATPTGERADNIRH